MQEAVELFERLLERNYSPEQVQEFIPLPMTRANVQYVTGIDPMTRAEIYVPRRERERRIQKALVRWKDPVSKKLVLEGLTEAGREDLVKKFLAHPHVRNPRPPQGKGKGRASGPARPATLDLDTCG